MADSVDRVFVHALNTVKKIPTTGASRPPPSDRLRLYGLYKQAMEGDVDGVIERPMVGNGMSPEVLQREKDKWDAWNSQKGVNRTEAKKRYIEALIDIMHRYATTPDAKELVEELEFVWNQIKHNSPASSFDSPKASRSVTVSQRERDQTNSDVEGPMKILSPMSEHDEAERHSQRLQDLEEDDGEVEDTAVANSRWQRRVERALTQMSAEVAALREQISTGREWHTKKKKSFPVWLKWFVWTVMKHMMADFVILTILLLWMRRRKDKRLEDLVRAALKLAREYVRKVLPSR